MRQKEIQKNMIIEIIRKTEENPSIPPTFLTLDAIFNKFKYQWIHEKNSERSLCSKPQCQDLLDELCNEKKIKSENCAIAGLQRTVYSSGINFSYYVRK